MAQNWRYSSRKARREPATGLDRSTARSPTRSSGYRADRQRPAGCRAAVSSVAGCRGVRLAGRAGLLRGLRAAEDRVGRRPRGAVSFFPRDEYFMRLALREAERALEHDDVPIGAWWSSAAK